MSLLYSAVVVDSGGPLSGLSTFSSVLTLGYVSTEERGKGTLGYRGKWGGGTQGGNVGQFTNMLKDRPTKIHHTKNISHSSVSVPSLLSPSPCIRHRPYFVVASFVAAQSELLDPLSSSSPRRRRRRLLRLRRLHSTRLSLSSKIE